LECRRKERERDRERERTKEKEEEEGGSPYDFSMVKSVWEYSDCRTCRPIAQRGTQGVLDKDEEGILHERYTALVVPLCFDRGIRFAERSA
jgi:hypothetical protein